MKKWPSCKSTGCFPGVLGSFLCAHIVAHSLLELISSSVSHGHQALGMCVCSDFITTASKGETFSLTSEQSWNESNSRTEVAFSSSVPSLSGF